MAFVVSAPFTPDSYQRLMGEFGNDPINAFVQIVTPILKRFYKQRGRPSPTAAFIDAYLRLVWETVHKEGVPSPLPMRELGTPTEFPDEYLFSLVQGVLSQLPLQRFPEEIETFSAQLLIAVLSSEFRTCRMSYQEKGPDGCISRQQADHCEDRISGVHCEDCPFWTALSIAQNEKMIRKSWASEDDFEAQISLFLPEDFRSLRIFWHLYIRHR